MKQSKGRSEEEERKKIKIRKEKVGGQQQQSEKKENKSGVDLKTNLLFFFILPVNMRLC